MKKSVWIAALVLAAMTPVWGQRLEPNFTVILYSSVPSENQATYEKMILSDGKKVGQAAIAAGLIRGRMVLKLTMPFLATEKYQYVMVTWYDKAPDMSGAAGPKWDEAAKKAGFASYSEFLAKLTAMGRKAVFQEVRRGVLGTGAPSVGDFVYMMAFKVEPGSGQDWVARQERVFLPTAKYRIQQGALQAWTVSARQLPNGEESDANYFISSVYKDSAGLFAGPGLMTEEIFRKIHPNASYTGYIQENVQWRERAKLVRTRTFRILDWMGTPPAVRSATD